jgi:hypothetical protein
MTELYEVNNLFLKMCPSVQDKWNEHLEWWKGDERGNYNDIAVFVHHTADCYEQNDQSCLNNIFSLVENLVLNGTEEVRGLMIVGFLETLQTYASNRDYGYKVFESYLGSESQKAWRQLEVLWKGKHSVLDVVRFQQAQKSRSE